jgi:2,5-diketo-D-gluconate reductase B
MEFATIKGEKVPKIGLGTWALRGDACRQTVAEALALGYRHIDTAEMYGNEEPIGEALAECGLPRDEIFVTTKVWNSHLKRAQVLAACRRSLERLGLDFVDLYLIHWPAHDVPVEETMEALDELHGAGLIRHAGVSNFEVDLMARAQRASQSGVFCNQVEYNPWNQEPDLLKVCQAQDIMLMAYTPLARGRVSNSEVLVKLGSRHEKTPAQVALRWLTQMDHVVTIPKAANGAHLRENLALFDFQLTEAEMAQVSGSG